MNRLQAACRRALCLPIRAYQHTLSPWIGRSCRFTPSCSNYTMQAILTHGCIKGILLGAWRIARCNPLGKWGYDPCRKQGSGRTPPAGCSRQNCLKTGIKQTRTLPAGQRGAFSSDTNRAIPSPALLPAAAGSHPSGRSSEKLPAVLPTAISASCDASHCGRCVLR